MWSRLALIRYKIKLSLVREGRLVRSNGLEKIVKLKCLYAQNLRIKVGPGPLVWFPVSFAYDYRG